MRNSFFVRDHLKYVIAILLFCCVLPVHAQIELVYPLDQDIEVRLAELRTDLANASTEDQTQILNQIGLVHGQSGRFQDAFHHFLQAEKGDEQNYCSKASLIYKSNLSLYALFNQSLPDAPKVKEARICSKQMDEPLVNAYVAVIEGEVEQNQGNFSKAFEHYFNALDELYSDSSLLRAYVNMRIASNLVWVGKHSYASYYLKQAENLQTDKAGSWYVEYLLLQAQVNNAQKKFKQAYGLADQAEAFAVQINNTYWQAQSVLIKAYIDLHASDAEQLQSRLDRLSTLVDLNQFPDVDYQTVLLQLEQAFSRDQNTAASAYAQNLLQEGEYEQYLHPSFKARAYRLLAKAQEKMGDHASALLSQTSYLKLAEQMSKTGAFREFEFLRTAFESSKKVKRDIEQIAETEISYQEQRNQQILKYAALVALLVLSVLLILLYRQIRIKQTANAELEERSSLINKQNQELRKMNSVLEESRQQAEAGSIAKSNFLAVTSHEIRTPMNGIMGMASLLLESKLDQEQTKYVETIQTSSENLLTILNDILDFSKIEAGKMNIETTMIDLDKLLDEVMIIFSKQAKDKNIQLDKFIGNAMIKHFKGDVLRIRQILINLVSNAIKFTENGRVKIVVELDELLRAQTERSRIAKLKFSVKDNGIGISDEKQKKIFESFEQEDSSTSRKYGGIGLGLSISKKLVELMGGEIGLSSEKGRGTTFYFTLNVEIPQEVAKQAVKEQGANDQPIPEPDADKISSVHPLKILLAEDNPFNKLFIDKLFEKFGYTDYLHAENGLEVLDILEHNKVDIILMDIQMPEMDGMEATSRIISTYGDDRPVIIALTADANDSSKDQYLDAGMDGFLSKPFKAEDLKQLLIDQSKKIRTLIN